MNAELYSFVWLGVFTLNTTDMLACLPGIHILDHIDNRQSKKKNTLQCKSMLKWHLHYCKAYQTIFLFAHLSLFENKQINLFQIDVFDGMSLLLKLNLSSELSFINSEVNFNLCGTKYYGMLCELIGCVKPIANIFMFNWRSL